MEIEARTLSVDEALERALDDEDSPSDVVTRWLELVSDAALARWMKINRQRLLHEHVREIIRLRRREPGEAPDGAGVGFVPLTKLAGGSSPGDVYGRRAPFLHKRIRALTLVEVREVIASYRRLLGENARRLAAWEQLEALLVERDVEEVAVLESDGVLLPEEL